MAHLHKNSASKKASDTGGSNPPKSVKVLRLIARLNVGGPAVHCLTLTRGMSELGFDTLLVSGNAGPDEAEYEELFDDHSSDLKHLKLDTLQRTPSIFRDLHTLVELYRIIRREKPDIVHTHTAKAGMLGRVAAMMAGVPIIVHTYHGHVLSGYFSRWVSYVIRLLERGLALGTTKLVTLSSNLKTELAQKFKICDASRIEVIPLGRNLDDLFQCHRLRGELRRELRLDEKDFIIGTIGRLVPIKDQQNLIWACSRLDKKMPWHLVIAGEGKLREELEQLAQELKIVDRVHFLGWRRDLPKLYADFDVFTLSSINEGTPLSIIESYASGCPVVSTAVGGVPNMMHGAKESAAGPDGLDIRDEGILVPSRNSVVLAHAFEYLWNEPSKRRLCGLQGKQAASQYTETALNQRMATFYRGLIEARS